MDKQPTNEVKNTMPASPTVEQPRTQAQNEAASAMETLEKYMAQAGPMSYAELRARFG